jgi:capsular exopolysaccharide synthesis family protein
MTAWSSTTGAEVSSERSALVEAARVVRERWWLIAVSFVVCLVITLALALHAQKQYTASASLLIRQSNLPALVDPTQAQPQDSTTLAHLQSDDVSLISSSPVAAAVKQMLHSSESVADLQSQVVATAGTTNDLITVSITDSSAALAAAKANAFATALVNYLNNAAQAQLVSGQARLRSELAQLKPGDPGRSAVQQALKQVIALEAVTNGGASVVEPATVPSGPSSPRVKRDVAIGGAVGILIGVALAFLLDLFDRRLKSGEAIERLYGLSALTSVPLRRRLAGDREAQIDLEPFRILRDGLSYISLRKHAQVILVTSAVSGEGKTWVASGLGRAMASAGKSVALIEGDVHRPALKRQLGLESNGRGLMNALVEGGNALDYVESSPLFPSLSVLPSGPFTPNSAELLRLPAMGRALEELAREFEFVVIDGPPLLPVADAQVLLDNAAIDVVLVAARPYLTTRDQIRRAITVLKRHPDKGIGLVINAVRERSRGYYDYTTQRDDVLVLEQEDKVLASSPPPSRRSKRSPRSARPSRSGTASRPPRAPRPEDREPVVEPSSETS